MIASERCRMRWVVLAGIALSLLSGGCEAIFNNKLLTRHFSNEDKQAAAQKRWNNFRGDVRLKMASQHLDAGQYADADKILTEARDLLPDHPEVYRLSARLYYETEQIQSAQTAIDKLLALTPNDVDGLFLAGRIAERSSDLELASKHYLAAVEAAPDQLNYRIAAAECVANRGNAEDAVRVILSANDYESSLPLRRLAMDICHSLGKRQDAASHARAVFRLAEGDDMMQIRAGMILAACGEREDAARILKPFVEIATAALDRPGRADSTDVTLHAEMLLAYARNCMALDQSAAALKSLKPLIRRDPSDELAWSLYCRAALRNGDLNLALRTIKTFNGRNKPILEMVVLQAYVCYLGGDTDVALDLADRALRIDATFEPAQLIKAKAAIDRDHASGTYPAWGAPALDAPTKAAINLPNQSQTEARLSSNESSAPAEFVDTSYVATIEEETLD